MAGLEKFAPHTQRKTSYVYGHITGYDGKVGRAMRNLLYANEDCNIQRVGSALLVKHQVIYIQDSTSIIQPLLQPGCGIFCVGMVRAESLGAQLNNIFHHCNGFTVTILFFPTDCQVVHAE